MSMLPLSAIARLGTSPFAYMLSVHIFNLHGLVLAIIVTGGVRVRRTHVVDSPGVRVLPASLVFEQRQEQLLADDRVRVEEQRPGGEDHIDSVDILWQTRLDFA